MSQPWPRVDRAEIEEALRELDLESAPATPSLAEYGQDLLQSALNWLSSRIGIDQDKLALAVGIFLIAASAALVLLFASAVSKRLRVRRSASADSGRIEGNPLSGRPLTADWRQRASRSLADGDVDSALADIWRAVASAVLGNERIARNSGWTRADLETSGKAELSPLLGDLEECSYGVKRVAAEEVAVVWSRLSAVLWPEAEQGSVEEHSVA